MSEDRMYRLWRLANLQVRRKRRRRLATNPTPRPRTATRRNHVWACDFIFDHCANGQKQKCPTLVDERTGECLATEVGATMPSSRVIAVLDRPIREHGASEFLRSDNGPEFLSKALRRWLAKRNVKPAFIEPGKPWQNGSVESFHDKLRDECLNQEWFRSRSEAAIVIEAWRRHYNEAFPHSSLGYRMPNEYKNALARTGRDTSFDQ